MSAEFVAPMGAFEELAAAIERFDLRELSGDLSDEAQDLVSLAFSARRDPFGGEWPAVKAGFAKQSSGHTSSYRARSFGDGIEVKSEFIGARLLAYGGVVRPVQAKKLRVPLAGGGYAFLDSVEIPARQVVPTDEAGPIWTPRLEAIIEDYGYEVIGRS